MCVEWQPFDTLKSQTFKTVHLYVKEMHMHFYKEMHIDSRLLESVDGKYSIMSEGPSCAGNWYRRSCKRKTEDSQAWKSF